MKLFQMEDTPADIVKVYPKASDIFKQTNINFCCKGNIPLSEAIEKKKEAIDGDAFLNDLNSAYQTWHEEGNVEINWDEMSSTELISHIVERHHHYLKEELEPIGFFVTKIFKVHGDKHPFLKDLYKYYHMFKVDMEAHMQEEESDLFPLIEAYDQEKDDKLFQEIKELNTVMEQDHELVEEFLTAMHNITDGFTPPADACGSFRTTYARLAELEKNTIQHVHLENNLLFKPFMH